ncbi:MAG: efflux RND transporter periplasmic adaptor subunit [Bacteroidota bacterium]
MSPVEERDLSGLRISRDKRENANGKTFPWKVLLGVILVVAVVVVALLVMRGVEGGREYELATATLTYPSQASTVLTANGYVVAQVKAAVASKGTGRLEYLGVEEGDKVTQNQIIARIEDDDVKATLARVRADLEVARADLKDARRTRERQQLLFDSNLISQAELDAAQARYERVRALIASAEAAVQEAEVALENTRIRAPFDGTVLMKHADIGEIVAPFAASVNSRSSVVTIADMSSLQVEADVSESNIMRVSVKQTCEIVLDAYPDTRYRGSVHKIVPTADRAKATVMTKVKFLEIDERVLPEMSAKVTFLSGEGNEDLAGAPPVLTVPASAVLTRDGTQMAFVVREGILTATPVKTGDRLGDRIEIRKGLTEGDQVVARPDPSLETGSRVGPPSP